MSEIPFVVPEIATRTEYHENLLRALIDRAKTLHDDTPGTFDGLQVASLKLYLRRVWKRVEDDIFFARQAATAMDAALKAQGKADRKTRRAEPSAPAETKHLPEIGDPDPAAVDYINRVSEQIPEHAMFRRYGLPPAQLLKIVRIEAEGIRRQAPFRAAVLAAVEEATGIPFRRACGECGGGLDDNARLYNALVCSNCALAAEEV